MLNEQRTGDIKSSDGAVNPARSDKQGAGVVTQAHGNYNEAVIRGNVYFGANQAAVTTTIALAATYTGLCIGNPAGSGFNLSILKAGWAFSVAPAAIASAHLASGFASTGIATHTTPLNVYNAKIGAPVRSVATVDGAATLVGTPIYMQPLIGGFTAAALFSQPAALTDIGGSIVVAPGGYVCIVTLTVGVGFGCIVWEEIPE